MIDNWTPEALQKRVTSMEWVRQPAWPLVGTEHDGGAVVPRPLSDHGSKATSGFMPRCLAMA